MKLADKIIRAVMRRYQGEITLPNFYTGTHESDVFVIRDSGICYDFEVKISRKDYFADFKKKGKHDQIQAGDCIANKFCFVVPIGLVKPEEVPVYAGLIYFDNGALQEVKSGRLLHKDKRISLASIAKSCYHREQEIRKRLDAVIEYRKDMMAKDREIAVLRERLEATQIHLYKYEVPRTYAMQSQKPVYKKYFPDKE